MLSIEYTSKFKKDYRRIKKQGKDIEKLRSILEAIASEKILPKHMRDHLLSGEYRGHRECHVDPDWLLIYKVDNGRLVLTATRTGSHSDLFN